MPGRGLAVWICDGDSDGLNFCERCRSIRPGSLHNRESAGRAENFEQIGRRGLGDNNHRAQKCHEFEAS